MTESDVNQQSSDMDSQKELLRVALSASRAVAVEVLFNHAAHDMANSLHQCHMIIRQLMKDRQCRENPRLLSHLIYLQKEIESMNHNLRSTRDLVSNQGNEPGPISANKEIPYVVEVWNKMFDSSWCTVQLILDAEEDVVHMSRDGFREMLSALLINAVEARAQRITVRTENLVDDNNEGYTIGIGKALRLLVQDDGHGIPSQKFEDLFKPGFSTKTDRQGLGLFIARSLARQASGELRCEASSHDRGAIFSVILPVRDR